MIKKVKARVKAKYRGLTNRLKKSIIHGDGRLSILGVRNQFLRFKKTISSSLSFLFLNFASKGRKVSIMKNMISRSFGGKLVIGLVLAVALAACGGGGSGGGVTPPPPAAPTATLASLAPASGAVDIAVDAKVVIGLNVTNATSGDASKLVYSCNNKTISFVATTAIAGGVSTSTLVTTGLNNADTCTVSGNVATSGAGGTVQTPVNLAFTVIAKSAVLKYSDIIIANTDLYGWYPMKMVLTSGATSGEVVFSAEKAVNATVFQTGEWPLFNCIFNKVKLSAGGVKFNCVDRASLVRQNLVWNPVTNRITEYDGSEGAYPALSDASWVDVQTNAPPIVGWKAFAEISAGWIWNSTTDGSTQHFKRKSDGADVILPLSIGLVKAFWAFSN